MRIFISADMEGATGVVRDVQTQFTEREYEFGCRMQLHDVNAVIEGALEAGADEVLVNDSHGRMINLDIRGMGALENPQQRWGNKVRLLSGSPKMFCMAEGYESADAAFFVGYHAKAGTARAILDHTVSAGVVHSAVLNGLEVGETGLNAALCAGKKIPLALVTGDSATCGEAAGLLHGNLTTACVKDAHGRMAADCLLPEESSKILKKAAMDAVEKVRSGKAACMDIGDGRFELQIAFHTSAQCDWAAAIPGAERVGGRTVRVTGSDIATMMRWAVSLIFLGGR